MINIVKDCLRKRKIQHFLYVHLLFLIGLVGLNISVVELTWSLAAFIVVVNPLSAVITHNKFKHEYVAFRNGVAEWFSLAYICVYSFWNSSDFKSYHILHHRAWLTNSDPTAVEIQQGKLRYYVGLTNPCAVPTIATKESDRVLWMNQHFWLIKIALYAGVILIFGTKVFFLSVIAQQFYQYVFSKIHDLAFHSNDHIGPSRDLPWLFPIYFNSAWHIDHHRDYDKQELWRWPLVNPQYWFTKLLVVEK